MAAAFELGFKVCRQHPLRQIGVDERGAENQYVRVIMQTRESGPFDVMNQRSPHARYFIQCNAGTDAGVTDKNA